MKQHQRITAALTSGRSSAEKMVLLTLASHANHDGSAWPSIATMVDESSLSRATVMRSLLSLESDGLLERTRTGRRTTYDVQWTGLMVRPLKSHGGTSDVSPSCARLEPIQEPIQGTDSSSSQTRAIPQPSEEEGSHNHGVEGSGADNPTPGAVVASGSTSRSTEPVRSTAVDPSKRAGARSQAGNRRYATTTEAASPGVTGAQSPSASARPRAGSASEVTAAAGRGHLSGVGSPCLYGPRAERGEAADSAPPTALLDPAAAHSPRLASSSRPTTHPQPAHRVPATIPRGQVRSVEYSEGVIEISTRSTTPAQRAELHGAGWRWDGNVWLRPDNDEARASLGALCPWTVESERPPEARQVAIAFDGRGAVVQIPERRERTAAEIYAECDAAMEAWGSL